MSPEILGLALQYVPKFGPSTLRQKLAQLGSVELIWESLTFPQPQKHHWLDLAQSEFETIQRRNIQLLILGKKSYPSNLSQLADISPVIYARGRIDLAQQFLVGMVGSRKGSSYGREATEFLVNNLIIQGCGIVSGMALGIDTMAHQSDLQNGGYTIAVWGSGLDQPYPPQNAQLAEQIIEQGGAIVSQFRQGD